jgi:hypothetical protein
MVRITLVVLRCTLREPVLPTLKWGLCANQLPRLSLAQELAMDKILQDCRRHTVPQMMPGHALIFTRMHTLDLPVPLAAYAS